MREEIGETDEVSEAVSDSETINFACPAAQSLTKPSCPLREPMDAATLGISLGRRQQLREQLDRRMYEFNCFIDSKGTREHGRQGVAWSAALFGISLG
jgi:hypothetical protein